MESKEYIKIGRKYKITYSDKKNIICKVLSIDSWGDCTVVYGNNKKALWHFSWLEEI